MARAFYFKRWRDPEPYRAHKGQTMSWARGFAGWRRLGQKTGHCRDRGRPAWRGHGHHWRPGSVCLTIYMGEEDVARQRPNVFWIGKTGRYRGAGPPDGARTLKGWPFKEGLSGDWVSPMGRDPLLWWVTGLGAGFPFPGNWGPGSKGPYLGMGGEKDPWATLVPSPGKG